MKLRYLRKALQDISEIHAFTAQHDARAARAVAARIKAGIDRLQRHPFSAREGRRPGTRELVITRYPYVVIYRIHDPFVEILRVYHTRRQPSRIRIEEDDA